MRLQNHEKQLFAVPLVVALGILAASVIRTRTRPHLLPAAVQITDAWATPGGKIVAVGAPAARRGVEVFPETLIYDAKSGALLDERAQVEHLADSSLSPDGRWMVTSEWSRRSRQNVAFELRDVKNHFAIVKRLPLSLYDPKWLSPRQFTIRQNGPFGTETKSQSRLLLFEVPSMKWQPLSQFSSSSEPIAQLWLAPDAKTAAIIGALAPKLTDAAHPNSRHDTRLLGGELKLVSWPGALKLGALSGDGWQTAQFLPDGHTLVALAVLRAGSTPMRADIARFDLATRRTTWTKIEVAERLPADLSGCGFSPDGRFLAIGNGKGPSQWTLWNTRSGHIALTIPSPARLKNDPYRAVHQPHFSPDGRTFVRPTARGIELWDLQ